MAVSLRNRSLLVLASTATLALTTVSSAAATDDEPPPPPDSGGEEQMWPPEDTHGEWLPIPDFFLEPATIDGCGSTLTLTYGHAEDAEYLAMVQADGTTRVEYRGGGTTDIVRESDGAELDDVPNDGPGHEIYSADGLTVTYSFDGPALIYAFDEVEAAVFAAQGLPPIMYYATGNTTERVQFPEDPQAPTIVSAEFLTDTAHDARNVCDGLDHAAATGHSG